MPGYIQQPNTSISDIGNSLLQLPGMYQQGKKRADQNHLKRAISMNDLAQGRADYDKTQSETALNQDYLAGRQNSDVGASLMALSQGGQMNAQDFGNIARFGKDPSQIGDLAQMLGQMFQSSSVFNKQDLNSASGQANASALAANKVLPEQYSQNAKGVRLNEFTGAQTAPEQGVQDILMQLAQSGGGASKPFDISESMLKSQFQRQALDEDGRPAINFQTGGQLMESDNERIGDFIKFIANNNYPTKAAALQGFQQPQEQPSISEEDIQHTMRVHGVTREEVLARLK